MIIERDKNYKIYVLLYAITSLSLLLLYVCACKESIIMSILINSPVFLLLTLDLISTGRTFIMDKEGCTVCFWKYQKRYTWNELKTKRIEEHNLPSMLRGRFSCPYLKEAVFAPYKIRKPQIIRVGLYSLFHPVTCIYVNFSLENENYKIGRYYEVKENEFMQKMNQWNVDLEKR